MKKQKKKPYKSLLRNAFWSFGQQLRYVPSTFVLSLLRVPINIGVSYALLYLPSLVIAEVTGGQPLSHAALTVGALILAIFVGKLIQRTVYFLMIGLQQTYRYKIQYAFYVKVLNCFYQLYESPKMRDLKDRAEHATWMWNGVQPIMDLPKRSFELLESVLSYILFGTIVSFVSPWLIPILTLAPVVNWLCNRLYQKWEYAHRDERAEIDRKLWYVQREPCDFATAKDIRIYGLIDWFKEMFAFFSKEWLKWNRKGILYGFLSRIADLLVILLRDGAAYALLIAMTLRGEITVDKFVLYFAAISSFASMIGSIVGSWTSLHSISLEISDLREYLDYPDSDGTGEANIADYLDSAPEIVFDHVSYSYEGAEQDTIHDLCLTIHAGEKLALVGLNGAGKTTLVKLLCGLYLPTSGEIRINGTPVSKFYRKDYYKLFSPVFQDIKTAFFSLAQTVSGQSDDQTDFDLAERCMRMAGLGDKIDSLPNGIHTKLDKQLNKDGTELSGGQAQKLMLARALYKDAPVLVLDEPTSALDPIAESEIYQQYHEMSAGKSALFISHRLASTRFCNRIVYLKDGRIAEEGSHEELIRKGGEYSALYEMQSCWYRDDAKKGEEIA